MSDNLVKRLQSGMTRTISAIVIGGVAHNPLHLEAADRIEALTAERDALAEKLEKAVEAWKGEAFMDAVWEALKADTSDLRKMQRILNAYRATLAQITGETDDHTD